MFRLKRLKDKLLQAKRVIIIGVGSDIRQDDSAGVLVAQQLKGFKGAKGVACKVLIGGTAPENYTSEIKRFKPSHVLIVDSAFMGLKAGQARLIDAQDETQAVSFSTHKLPFKVLADYLTAELGCSVILIAIEPKALGIYKQPSTAVKSACRKISACIKEALK
jgi:hydrogenase 3 maturation protease